MGYNDLPRVFSPIQLPYNLIFLFSAESGENIRAAMALFILFVCGLASSLVFLCDTYYKMLLYTSIFGLLNGKIIEIVCYSFIDILFD